MKKLLSIILMIYFLMISPFTSLAQTDLDAFEHDKTAVSSLSEAATVTKIDDIVEDFESHSDFLSSYTTSFQINETPDDFIRKIGEDSISIQGTATVFDQKNTISTYYQNKKISRFDLINIAYKTGLLSEKEKIECYCTVLENRKTENIKCMYSIMTEMHHFSSTLDATDPLYTRITDIYPLPIKASSLASEQDSENSPITSTLEGMMHYTSIEPIDEYPTKDSDNFIIYYHPDNTLLSEETLSEILSFFESTRSEYLALGYNEPLLPENETKYSVLIGHNPDAENYETVPCVKYETTCTSFIHFPNYTAFNSEFRNIFAHEYYHAIQFSYRYDLTNSWFYEATAVWGALQITDRIEEADNTSVIDYLATADSLYNYNGYGTVLLPMTIQNVCGTNAIRAIWEQYGEQTSNALTFQQLKEDVIDEALSQYGHSFDSVFLQMAKYNYAPPHYYAMIHPGGASAVSTWEARIDSTTTTAATSRRPYFTTAISNASVVPYSSNYHKFVPDVAGQTSQLKISVTVSGTGAHVGFGYKNINDEYQIGSMTETAANTFTYTASNYGSLSEFCVIVSNTKLDDNNDATSENLTYSISYHVERGTSTSVTLHASTRYWENVVTLGKGEYKDFIVTFAAGGTQLIQTFGTADTYLFLYDSNGNQLNATTTGDDAGYGNNALLSYSVSSNSTYRIRVTFYSATTTGDIKLGIISTATYANYEAIPNQTNNPSVISATLSGNAANVYTFTFSATQTRTVNVSANGDVYLYIIDPTSTEKVKPANNQSPDLTKQLDCLYNDDYNNTSQSQITKLFYSDTPYLVIVTAFNPATGSGRQYYMSFSQATYLLN